MEKKHLSIRTDATGKCSGLFLIKENTISKALGITLALTTQKVRDFLKGTDTTDAVL